MPELEHAHSIRTLLDWLTIEPARPCRMCGKQIWFLKDPRTEAVRPYTAECVNHNLDCPGAERYRTEAAQRTRQSPLFSKHPEAI